MSRQLHDGSFAQESIEGVSHSTKDWEWCELQLTINQFT